MKVLLVDDDASFRRALAEAIGRVLMGSAPEMLGAAGCKEAIAALRSHSDIDVVVLDEVLGGGGAGSDVLRELSLIVSRPRVMFLTAHPDAVPVGQHAISPKPADFFLTKDTRLELVCEAIRMLAAQRDSARRYTEQELLGRPFCETLVESCDMLSTSCSSGSHPSDLLGLIRSCAMGFLTGGVCSAEDVYQYALCFNQLACAATGLPDALTGLVRRMPDVERALYRIPGYRDHLVHQMQVFLLGFCIMAQVKCSGPEHARNLSTLGLLDESWLDQWYLVSAFHDIGYPFEKLPVWVDVFFADMLGSTGGLGEDQLVPSAFNWSGMLRRGPHLSNFDGLTERIAAIFRADPAQAVQLRRDLFDCFFGSPNHAAMSALVLLGLAGARRALDAAVAVCLHERRIARVIRKTLSRPLSSTEAPMGCLLAFCDTAQEWGRIDLAALSGHRTAFGVPRFHSLRCDDGIHLELVYPSDFPVELQEKWAQVVYEGVLGPLCHCWDASGLFHIIYYRRDRGGELQRLGRLDF